MLLISARLSSTTASTGTGARYTCTSTGTRAPAKRASGGWWGWGAEGGGDLVGEGLESGDDGVGEVLGAEDGGVGEVGEGDGGGGVDGAGGEGGGGGEGVGAGVGGVEPPPVPAGDVVVVVGFDAVFVVGGEEEPFGVFGEGAGLGGGGGGEVDFAPGLVDHAGVEDFGVGAAVPFEFAGGGFDEGVEHGADLGFVEVAGGGDGFEEEAFIVVEPAFLAGSVGDGSGVGVEGGFGFAFALHGDEGFFQ